MSRRTFIPPYLLQALSRADDPGLAALAARTLLDDERFRQERLLAVPRGGAASARLPRDDGSHPSRGIYDAGSKQTLPGRKVRVEGAAPTGDAAADEAYDGIGATWELFSQIFGRDSLDGLGEPLIGSVHYDRAYDNAFWNGTQMVFGDGDGVIFNRFTLSVDVIGHELTHAVTERTAGLVYDGQSGALNESLSDVFGSLVKQRSLGQTAEQADWLIGAGLLAAGVHGRAIRSMSQPGTAYDDPRLGKDPQPDSMAGYVTTADDNGGVHVNSGIPNRAFYLVATSIGGPAWEAPGQIWYDTILGPIKPDCDFATFAALTLAAASARYGETSAEASAVAEAWATVGVHAGAASPGPRRKAPAPGSAPGRLTVTRTGGFAGIPVQRTVSLAELPSEERREWTAALRDPSLPDVDGGTVHPDAFCYGITSSHPEVDVQLPEHAMPERLLDLVRRFLGEG